MARGRSTSNKQPKASPSFLQSAPASVMGPRLEVILSAAALMVIGLVMVFSTTSITGFSEQGDAFGETIKQCAFAVVGIIVCVLTAWLISMDVLRTYAAEGLWLLSFILLVATAVVGTVGLGAKRWLFVGPIGIQPSEFAKITITIMAAKISMEYVDGIADRRTTGIKIFVMILIPLFIMVFLQSDLGTTMICIVAVLAVMMLCGLPMSMIFGVIGIIVFFAVIAIGTSSYRMERLNFTDPWADPQGKGYQLVHSLLALASGGVLGVGLGNSFEKMLYLPEAETDFIFSIIGEEGGLIACVFVVVCFCIFLYGGFQIALNSRDKMGTYLAGALTAMLVFQAFLNILCAIGFAPTTGKPLPFVSSGGSSMLSSCIVVGLILSVSFHDSGDETSRRRGDLTVLSAEPPMRGRDSRRAATFAQPHLPSDMDPYGGFKPVGNANRYRSEEPCVNRNRGYSDGYSSSRGRGSRRGRGASDRSRRR